MKIRLTVILLSLVGASTCFAAPGHTRNCTAPAYRQFNFWAGDWDAYDSSEPDKPIARNRVDIILGDCVVREVYRQSDGLIGRSFSIYDAARKVWHQTWVTNRGQLLVIEGQFRNGRMMLAGTDRDASGRSRLVKAFWMPVEGGVREVAHRSIDGGKTWTLWFDITFRPHRNSRH
ncbi:MAG TPA: hypothetical protein VFL54_02925 [Gammaproteobacteria bacterium]|nr:hypothetical protein [Gammaproteobacteria bacterium]